MLRLVKPKRHLLQDLPIKKTYSPSRYQICVRYSSRLACRWLVCWYHFRHSSYHICTALLQPLVCKTPIYNWLLFFFQTSDSDSMTLLVLQRVMHAPRYLYFSANLRKIASLLSHIRGHSNDILHVVAGKVDCFSCCIIA